MIDDQDPDANCDCSKFNSPILRAGCENFYSLQWNNAEVVYEEVSCPFELDRLNCWEENGGGYPFDIPQFCASNIDDPSTSSPTSEPTAESTAEPTSPSACVDDPTDKFFFRMKDLSDGSQQPLYKDCEFLSTKTEQRIATICSEYTDSYGGFGPAREVCRSLCDTCNLTAEPTSSPTDNPTSLTSEPTAEPTPEPSDSPIDSPTTCTDNPQDPFFFKMKDGAPIFKTCDWLSKKNASKIDSICTKKTDSFGGIGPAKEVCKVLCDTC